MKTRILAVTGTKGKTTVGRILAHALSVSQEKPILQVDTQRVLLGKEEICTAKESYELSGMVPTVSPGRFLLSLKDMQQPLAVLEASVGCKRQGLGYRHHEVGIFTNVYDDHLGAADYLQSREDIAQAKSFIFSKIKRGGWAVYNADDELVISQLSMIKPTYDIHRAACTLTSRNAQAGETIVATVQNECLVIRDATESVLQVPLRDALWILQGRHEPTLYNALFVLAALYGHFAAQNQAIPANVLAAFTQFSHDPTGGRMVQLEAKAGYTVILDFAHEKESLKHIAEYARTLCAPGGKVIGVLRLSEERPNAHIIETTKTVAPYYDTLFIYDKIDGYYKTAEQAAQHLRVPRAVGEVSALMLSAAREVGVVSESVLREDEAMAKAAKTAQPGDVVICIVNQPIRSLDFSQKAFTIERDIV